jgi:hypothetical protein
MPMRRRVRRDADPVAVVAGSPLRDRKSRACGGTHEGNRPAGRRNPNRGTTMVAASSDRGGGLFRAPAAVRVERLKGVRDVVNH